MKLLKTILVIAVHGAQASHKVTTNAVEAETTQRLAVEAATAGVVKMPGAVAKLFGQTEGDEVPAYQAQGAVGQHQEKFEGRTAPGKLDIYYLSVEGPPADFVLVDTKSGAEHRIPIEAGTHITYDNAVYEHRVDANPDSKRTMLGPASLPSGGRRLEAVGGSNTCTPCCTDKDGECEVSGCGAFETCQPCSYSGQDNAPETIDFGICGPEEGGGVERKLTAGMPSFEAYRKSHKGPEMRRNLRFGSGGPSVVPADGCCISTLEDSGCSIGPFNGYPKGENTGEYCAPGCLASCDAKGCVKGSWVGDDICDSNEGFDLTCYDNDNGDCDDNHGGGERKRMLTARAPSFEEHLKLKIKKQARKSNM